MRGHGRQGCSVMPLYRPVHAEEPFAIRVRRESPELG
jgi:hypothetical protein